MKSKGGRRRKELRVGGRCWRIGVWWVGERDGPLELKSGWRVDMSRDVLRFIYRAEE